MWLARASVSSRAAGTLPHQGFEVLPVLFQFGGDALLSVTSRAEPTVPMTSPFSLMKGDLYVEADRIRRARCRIPRRPTAGSPPG